MNIYECEEFFKQLNPEKQVTLTLDENCERLHEIMCTNGILNNEHHVEYNRVKVVVDNEPAIYVNISPHRITYDKNAMKEILRKKLELN